ncbi:hypothetical protein LTR94_030629, partial [Friedmanniomyces endolithicus]
HTARRRVRRGHLPVHHRSGDAAQAAVGDAQGNLRPGFGPGRSGGTGPDAGGHGGGRFGAGGLCRGHGLRHVLDRRHRADAGRARRPADAQRTAGGLHPAVRRFGHRAPAGHRRPAGRVDGAVGREHDAPVAVDRPGAGGPGGRAGGRRLRHQSGVPLPGPQRRARGDDGRRPAGGGGHGLDHGRGRPVDGHGRLPGGGAAVGLDLPASAGSGRRA